MHFLLCLLLQYVFGWTGALSESPLHQWLSLEESQVTVTMCEELLQKAAAHLIILYMFVLFTCFFMSFPNV